MGIVLLQEAIAAKEKALTAKKLTEQGLKEASAAQAEAVAAKACFVAGDVIADLISFWLWRNSQKERKSDVRS